MKLLNLLWDSGIFFRTFQSAVKPKADTVASEASLKPNERDATEDLGLDE